MREPGKIGLHSFEDKEPDYVLRHPRDPRVVAVLKRDEYSTGPDGDVFAPAISLEYRGAWRGDTIQRVFVDETVTDAFVAALNYYGRQGLELVERYMRAFYGTRFVEVSSTVHRDMDYVIFDTPSWREAMGMAESSEALIADDVRTWQDCLDGDVWAVGVLVNKGHLAWEEDEETPTDEQDGWEWSDGLIFGYYGDRDAVTVVYGDMFLTSTILDTN